MSAKTTVSIKDAITWIAFRGKKPTAEEMLKNDVKMEEALAMLQKAISYGLVNAWGTPYENLDYREAPETLLTNITERSKFNIADNSIIQGGSAYYLNIKIDEEELYTNFPEKNIGRPSTLSKAQISNIVNGLKKQNFNKENPPTKLDVHNMIKLVAKLEIADDRTFNKYYDKIINELNN